MKKNGFCMYVSASPWLLPTFSRCKKSKGVPLNAPSNNNLFRGYLMLRQELQYSTGRQRDINKHSRSPCPAGVDRQCGSRLSGGKPQTPLKPINTASPSSRYTVHWHLSGSHCYGNLLTDTYTRTHKSSAQPALSKSYAFTRDPG